jgi:hypothetical protein
MHRPQHPATALIILALCSAAAPSTALATNCKALSKAACQRTPACTWVDPYKRLDEVKVQGFCRATEPPKEAADD